ncbi:Fe(3+) dicitrate ABC transporter ATP-binding protein FecE [Vibrio viridaestus]|uniref:Iron-dicitrate ABC transporter ATP-binding subunit n=1 Tax=Vibrio viridaestus TaxID=2487322 RepID=A0A3N9TKF5_9VIBR|nr:Fe(3+) dicitrate ABC transporter ATP-binding protein FecE [Vibrio viridaestus]RQW64829.1 iron-dicitrate ABC transporter ATP-binding subunit [Vibrio viridaestus]
MTKQLSTANLCVGYQDTIIVSDVSVTVPQGKITALIGPNGCGKSTLLKSLARILIPVSGQILCDNQNIKQWSAKRFAQTLALLPQSQLPPEGITVREAVGYGRSPYTGFWGQLSDKDNQLIEKAMQATGVDSLAEKRVTDLSGGQCQRVWLAMALAQDTEFVLLDEPTTYLDLNHQVELMKLMQSLRDENKTVVTVLHDINQACRYCDYLIVMKNGQIVCEGTPEQVLTSAMLEDVFSLNAEIHRDPVSKTPICVVR